MSRAATGAAPGKVILFGEHAVVYGRPAVAASLATGLGATVTPFPGGPELEVPGWDLHVRLDQKGSRFDAIARGFATALDAAGVQDRALKVTVDGELPPGVGLGSSAAFAVAVLRALGEWNHAPLTGEPLLAAAHAVETVFHGTPSGLDHTVIATGGCLRFERGAQTTFTPVPLARPVPAVVAWAPRKGSTRQAVAGLRVRHEALPAHFDRVFDAIGAVTEAGLQALASGDFDRLGQLFDLNHGLLNACGVSNVDNERMVAVAREAGAAGAKLTGAGLGGAVVAVTPLGADRVVEALQRAGYKAFQTRLGTGR
ncbi:MAG: mevalonate kinase [Myxococcales bacterium]|nr:mevalonate kinase [Myxococcales bacterium]